MVPDQPDQLSVFIINSAGQDNHYSDPITNMKFTAQGYALLNRKLNPHIAVLEGGYSIQGALPYVNSGIVLAMAGLDFSGLREPDYDAGYLRQDKRVTDYIVRVSDIFHQSTAISLSPEHSLSKKEISFMTQI